MATLRAKWCPGVVWELLSVVALVTKVEGQPLGLLFLGYTASWQAQEPCTPP